MKTNQIRRPVLLAALAPLALFSVTGCTTTRVEPWQRAALADYTMQPERDPLYTAMSEHGYFSREATAGGRSVGSSGCGCN